MAANSEDLISAFIDEAAIKKQADSFTKQLADIYNLYQKINQTKITLEGAKSFTEVSTGAKSLSTDLQALTKSATQIEQTFVKLAPAIQSADQAIENINQGLTEGAQALAVFKLRLEDNTKAQKELQKQYKDGVLSLTQFSEKSGELIKREQDLKVQIADLTSAQKQFAKENNAVAGSMDQAGIRLGRLREEYRSLTDEEKAAPFGENLKKAIDALDPAIKSADGSIGNFQRNVGNYSGAVKVLEKSLEDVGNKFNAAQQKGNDYSASLTALENKLTELSNAGQQQTEAFRSVEEQFKNLNAASTQNQGVIEALQKEYGLLGNIVNSQANGFVSMREEIRNNQIAIEQLIMVYGEDSDIVKELIQQNGALRDSFSDLQATQRTVGSDTFAFDGLLEAGQALAGLYGAATGAAALFGAENEDLQKQLNKLVAVMAIVQGVQAAVNALQQEGAAVQLYYAIQTKVAAAAQRLFAFAMTGATLAAKALRIALLATGLGAIIVLLSSFTAAAAEASESTDDLAKSQEDLNKAMDDYIDRLEKVAIERQKFRNAAAGGLDDEKRRLKLLEAGGAAELDIFKLKQDINNKELADLYNQYSTFKGIEDAKTRDSETNQAKLLELGNKIRDKQNDVKAEQLEFEKNINKKSTEDAKKRAEDYLKILEKERQAQFDISRLTLEDQATRYKETADDESRYYEGRIFALNAFYKTQQEIIQGQLAFDLNKPDITKGEKEKLQVEANLKLSTIQRQFAAEQTKILQDQAAKELELTRAQNERRLQLEKDFVQAKTDLKNDEVDSLTKGAASTSTAYATIYARDEKALYDSYQSKKITQEEYEKQSLALQLAFQQKQLQYDLQTAKKTLDIQNLTGEERENLQKKIAEIELELAKTTGKAVEDIADQSLENLKKKISSVGSLAQNLGAIFTTLSGIGTDRESAELENQLDLLEKKKQKDIEVATQSITNEQDRAAAITVINAKADAQKEQLERKKRQVQEKQARYEKAANIANIITTTALAVVTTLADKTIQPFFLRIPLAATIGALGAVQVARAIATPIPKYRDGKFDDYEGPAIVGDGRRQEVITRANGSVELTPAIDTLTYLGKQDRVYPNIEQYLEFGAKPRFKSLPDLPKDIDSASIVNAIGGLKKEMATVKDAIKNKREYHLNITKEGMNLASKEGNQWTEYINDNINF